MYMHAVDTIFVMHLGAKENWPKQKLTLATAVRRGRADNFPSFF